VTSNRRTERLVLTFKEPSSWVDMTALDTVILRVEEAFYADTGSLMPLSLE